MVQAAWAQLPEIESNNTFATATPIQAYNNMIANVGNGDDDDYYMTVLPADGTLTITVQGTNASVNTGYLYLNGYDRRKSTAQIGAYIGNSSAIAAGATIAQTITLHGQASDTFYFRFYSNRSFNYQFYYVMQDQSPNDAEPNNSFATALPINIGETKKGHTNYEANGSTYDPDDYYQTILPVDGTLKVYVKGINRSGTNSYLYMTGYDRRKSTTQFGEYITATSNVPAGATIYDTITLHGQAADTFYFRLYAANNKAFEYEFRYEIVDQSPNDIEPNNNFATALPINMGETKRGHTNYEANGGTYDPDDYYQTILPVDGTLKVYVKGINRSGTTSYLYMTGYDRRKTTTQFGEYITATSNVPAGAKIYDTITLHGQAADTFYFRLYAFNNKAFEYEFRYEIVDQNPNDIEPNNSFSTALPINIGETKRGHTNYKANGGTYDPDDYYQTILPVDGTLKVYVKGINRSGTTSYLYMNGYDRRKTTTQFGGFITGTSNVPAGATIYDTITLHSRAADTFYFHLYASPNKAFEYEFRYEIADTSLNDTENNNSFATAQTLNANEIKWGHTGYRLNGTSDLFDYYKTEYASTDSLKLYLQATNYSGLPANFTLTGYNVNLTPIYSRTKSNVPNGVTVYDSVKILVTAPQTIYNRLGSVNDGFSYNISLNSKLPGNGFGISGPATACNNAVVYKAVNVADNDVTYHWSLLSGGSLVFTDSIATVTFNSTGTHILQLYLSNAIGNSITKQFVVTVNEQSPSVAPVVTVKGRYLDIATIPPGAEQRWFKDGVGLGITDSVIYAATPGSYTAKFANNCGEGPTSAAIVFNTAQTQTISFPQVSNIGFGIDSFRVLTATASSGLPIVYSILSGPGIIRGDSLFVTAAGPIRVAANQFGNADFGAAPTVVDTVLVINGPQAITFNPIANKIFGSGDFALDAIASSGLPVSFGMVSGNATISGKLIKMNGAGMVQVKAMQGGNANYTPAPEVVQSFCIGVRQLQPISGVALTCAIAVGYTTPKINGAIYEWSLSGGGILTANGDSASVLWQTPGSYVLSVKAYSLCDTVRSAAQTIAVTVLPNYVTGPVAGLVPSDNEAGLSLPLGLQWAPATNATAYDVYVWPSGQPQPALPLDSGLLQVNYDLSENIALNVPYSWKVVAKNVCSSSTSDTLQFTAVENSNGKPDLILDTMSFQANIYQGLPLTVTWRVKNIGVNGTGAVGWRDRIYLSPSTDLRTNNARLLGIFNNPSHLLPGETYTQTKTVMVPTGIEGSWHLFVITDNGEAFCLGGTGNACTVLWAPVRYNHSENNVRERSEQNNYRFAQVLIGDGLLPDLRVQSVGVPFAAFGGSTIPITYTVKNEGPLTASGKRIPGCPQRAWRDRFFISNQPVFDIATAYELPVKEIRFLKPGSVNCFADSIPYVDYLLPDSSYTVQHQVLIPYNFFGKQYIHVYTNGYNDAYEGPFSTNNIRTSDSINITPTPPADLVVTNIQNLTGVQSGQLVNVSYTVTNQGANPPLEMSWRDSVFICSSAVFSNSNVIVKAAVNRNLIPNFITGATYTVSPKLQIPNGIAGNYYVFVKTDARGEVYEFTQEGNNLTRGNLFTITLATPVDLQITSILLPDTVTENKPFNLIYTIRNNGPGTIKEGWRDYFYADTDSLPVITGINIVEDAHGVGDSLTAGAERSFTQQVVIKQRYDFGNRHIYIIGKTDGRGDVYEHLAEENNIRANTPPLGGGSVFVKAELTDTIIKRSNLFVQSFTAPANVNANTTATIQWTVKNKGPLATTKTYWQDRFVLSADTVISNNDIILKSQTNNQYTNTGLLPDSFYQRSATVQIPLELAGSYYIIGVTDYFEYVVNDSTRDDNSYLFPINIIAAPVPNLVITPLNNLPDSIWGGSIFTLKYRVDNTGPITANGRWFDKAYVGRVNSLGLGLPVNYKEHTVALAPGASYTDSLLIQVPTYMSGNYHIALFADARNDIFEGIGGDANNISVRPSTIYPYNSRPAPDLVVSALTVPDSVRLGKNILANYTITNAGSNPATGNLANSFYLSANPVFESSLDQLTATNESNIQVLQPGQSIMGQISGKALPKLAGNYRSILRTNARNTLYEGPNTNNNLRVSDTTTHIDAQALLLDVAKPDTLLPNEGNYYKVTVGADLDLSVALTTAYAGTGNNALYIAYNRVPSETSFDATGINPQSLNQQVLISATQPGTYYIKAQSFALPINEPISLLVKALPFSILQASPSVMGQGTVTGTLNGAGFKPNTQILLRKNGSSYQVGTIGQFINSTQLHVRWQTSAVPLGVYDVVAINPGGIETLLPNAITIEATREYDLEVIRLLPAEVRPWGCVYTYKGVNKGNVNIPVVHGDITMIEKNGKVQSVATTGPIRRFTKYFPQADSLNTEDWYIAGKTRVVPFIGRNLAPGEAFTITVDTRFDRKVIQNEQQNLFPLQLRIFGYSAADFVKEQVRNFEMLRLILANNPRSNQYPNHVVIQTSKTNPRAFVENMMNEYVVAGLMNWADTIGTNLPWNCSRCLQLLPEIKPLDSDEDVYHFNPASFMVVGKEELDGAHVFGPSQKLLLEMNKGLYWSYYNGKAGAPGIAGEPLGWDMVQVNGPLHISATAADKFTIAVASLAFDKYKGENVFSQLGGWSPAFDTSYLIVAASGGITGYDSSKFAIDLQFFADLNPLRRGRFGTELRSGVGGDSILLVWRAYRPGFGEDGVDGVDGGPGEPGSPGGKGGRGNAQHPKGGKGGKGGRGSDEIGSLNPPQVGGRGGDGGEGYGDGGDGGDAGKTGNAFSLACENDGETGGNGADAGLTGGNGGKGGQGGEACNATANAEGGKGGNGGIGGNGYNSGFGGRGGNGGAGGSGGAGCSKGLPGGIGGEGGAGGSGPLGSGTYGASGPKGVFGPPFDCPPCSEIALSGNAASQKAAESMIDYAKAAYSKNPVEVYIEWTNQSTKENSPSMNLVVTGADLLYTAISVGLQLGTSEWTLACKGISTVLKVGDYTLTQLYGDKYKGSTAVRNLAEAFSTISSVPDMLAFGLKKLSALGNGVVDILSMVKPCDPNEIVGPKGYSDYRFVSRNTVMPYTIHFENDSLAEVAAQRVIVRQPISLKADPLTFKLGQFNIGGRTFEVPADRSNYFTVLDFDSLGYQVQVTAGVDVLNREAFWIFNTIDPTTGLPPSNALQGFLPPNDSTLKGTGFVTYSIKPFATAITGDSITAKADIIFDENEPIETNTWANVVDAFAPTSHIVNLPDSTPNTEITLQYTGVDDAGGSGIQSYNLYVSDNGGAKTLYLSNFSGADTIFYGQVGHTYRFYAAATDHVGNIESERLLDSVKIIAGQQVICPGASTVFQAKITGNSYQWQVNTGSGFVNLTNGGVHSGVNGAVLSLNNPPTSMYGYEYRCLVNGNVYSELYLLKFGVTWEGSVSSAWENPANWGCGSLPDAQTDVVINGGKSNYPMLSSNATVRSLRLNTGASGTVQAGYTLTVRK